MMLDKPKWEVKWVTSFDGDQSSNPKDAAALALKHIMNEGSIAHVFTVKDNETGECYSVDLNAKKYTEVSDIEPEQF